MFIVLIFTFYSYIFKFSCLSYLSFVMTMFVIVRTLLHIQERLRVEHSLQDVLLKTAIKVAPPAPIKKYWKIS